ncbi:MAG: delta-60 repeat domain-containing protein, partial [Planctomycetota bacterium]
GSSGGGSDSGSSAPLFSTGVLDASFGALGVITTTLGTNDDYGYAMALQTDGKIVVAGMTDNSINFSFALIRYTSAGALDNTFGTGGVVTTAIGNDSTAMAIALQTDGRIIAAGTSNDGANDDITLVRYTVTGALDATFGTGGVVTTTVGNNNDYARAIVLQSDNKIVIAGDSTTGVNSDIVLARYNADGSLDNTFDTDGVLTTTVTSNNDVAFDLAVQPDGRIVVAGYSNNGANFTLVRYNTDGSLDNNFNTDGVVTTTIGSGGAAMAAVLQPDGKIIAAGGSNNGVNDDFTVARYNTNGSLDVTFNADGVVTSAFGTALDYANAVVLQPDGKIIAAGSSDTNNNLALIRYNSDGSLDTTFGTGGGVNIAAGGGGDIYGIALQPDNRIVVAGYSYNGSNNDFAVLRYWR